MPGVEYLDARVQQAVVDFARGGGTVVLGPRLPDFDARLQPDTTLVDALHTDPVAVLVDGAEVGRRLGVGAGQVVHLDPFTDSRVLDAALEPVGDQRAPLRSTTTGPQLDIAVHTAVDDPRRHLVYVANPTAEPVTARTVPIPGIKLGHVRDVWHDEVEVTGDGFDVHLGAHDIAIHACTTDEPEGTS